MPTPAQILNTQSAKLEAYATRGRQRIGGWFDRIDAELYRILLTGQSALGVTGGCAEIGVHHGKSFIPLCLGLAQGEKAVCIDIFEDQAHNRDKSGHGDYEIFRANLDNAGIAADVVEVIRGSSLNVTADAITSRVGPVRFFSVDGGHWFDIVKNDLELAHRSRAPGLIIALDDAFRPDWPEVASGMFSWHNETERALVPLVITKAKLYLADRAFADRYAALMEANAYLSYMTRTRTQFLGREIPILCGPWPGVRGHADAYLRAYQPKLLQKLRGVKNQYLKRRD